MNNLDCHRDALALALATMVAWALGCTQQAQPDPQLTQAQQVSVGGEQPQPAPEVVKVDPATTAEVLMEEGPDALDDAEIAEAITGALMLSPHTHFGSIEVAVADGVVELSGQVQHLQARREAVRIARHIKGVRSVVDRLSVQRVSIPDARLERAVREALSVDPATARLGIAVRASDGRVTLEGSVESFAERTLAERAAAAVFGVWDVNNQLSLKPMPERSDAEIQAELVALLRADARVRDGGIEVSTEDANVYLKGVVGSAAERARAIRLAWLRGVEEVHADGLEVRWWARDRLRRSGPVHALSPSQIRDSITDALAMDPRIGEPVQVQVERGVATLRGEVETVAARVAAEDTAANTLGVWRVRNWLRVAPPETSSDAQLQARVERAMQRDPYLRDEDVTVEVRRGAVELEGRVDHPLDRLQAGHVAARVGGVLAVHNHIALAQAQPRSDWELRQDVRDKLFWNFWVDDQDVRVHVADGIVTLRGSVDDWQAYVAALRSAREAGALHVHDRLRIEDAPGYVHETMHELRPDGALD